MASVGKTEPEKKEEHKCPNCEKPIILDDMKKIFPDCKDDKKLQDCMNAYNTYMSKLGMNTCWNKAHFFAQARVEVGTSLSIHEAEILNYSTRHLLVGIYSEGQKNWKKGNPVTKEGGYYQEGTKFSKPKFSSLLKPENRHIAEAYGRKDLDANNDKKIQKCDQEKLANFVYADVNRAAKDRIGNTQEGDGWRFRGRGLVQLTGREGYQKVYNIIKDISPTDIMTDAGAMEIEKSVSLAVLTSMGFWKLRKIFSLANGCKDADIISKKIGTDVDYAGKRKAFDDITSKLFKVDECLWGKVEEKKEEKKDSKCPDDCSQCFEYQDVVPQPKINNQSGNKNHNRYKNEPRTKSNGTKYYHSGTDILAVVGTEVHSMMCGEVVHVRTDLPQNDYAKGYESATSYGNTVTIKSKDKDGKIVYHFYAHLSQVNVKVGELVKHNKIIGLSGSTGNAMHVEVKYRHIHVEAGTSYSTTGGSDGKQRCKINADLNPEKYMKSQFDDKGNTI
ncbi:MAG: peptidoglycan DD-metalloendopeptidase family protein [Flavobacteriaceae bacterium]|jgi:predicted chitinase|nr:peptidoglycan DD-metalloendopeptidase family protein [Flavobacteriaceae bacterium]